MVSNMSCLADSVRGSTTRSITNRNEVICQAAVRLLFMPPRDFRALTGYGPRASYASVCEPCVTVTWNYQRRNLALPQFRGVRTLAHHVIGKSACSHAGVA